VPTSNARYLDEGYLAVRGMSSLFAGRIIVRLLAQQTASGSVGHVAEIGVFEGRLLIAMALSLADGERALAVDPSPGRTRASAAASRRIVQLTACPSGVWSCIKATAA